MKVDRIIHAVDAQEVLDKFADLKREYDSYGSLNMIYFDGSIQFVDLFVFHRGDGSMIRVGQIHLPSGQQYYKLEER